MSHSRECSRCGLTKEHQEFKKTHKWTSYVCKECVNEYSRAWRFNITIEELRDLLNVDLCEICEEPFPKGKKYIDHCHEGGHIRGILCNQCNTALGKIERKPEMLGNILSYLLKDANS